MNAVEPANALAAVARAATTIQAATAVRLRIRITRWTSDRVRAYVAPLWLTTCRVVNCSFRTVAAAAASGWSYAVRGISTRIRAVPPSEAAPHTPSFRRLCVLRHVGEHVRHLRVDARAGPRTCPEGDDGDAPPLTPG